MRPIAFVDPGAFMRTDLVSPVRKLLNSGCGKQLGNQLGNPVNRPKAMTMTLSCRLTIFSNSELSVESAIIDRHDVDRSSTERKSNPRCRTYRIDNELYVANARILSHWRIDRHRRPRDLAYINPRPASDELLGVRRRILRPLDRRRIRHCPRSYRHLAMSRRGLPGRRLRAQSTKRKHNTESKDQRLHHNPLSLYVASHCLAEPSVGLSWRDYSSCCSGNRLC